MSNHWYEIVCQYLADNFVIGVISLILSFCLILDASNGFSWIANGIMMLFSVKTIITTLRITVKT